MTQREVARAMGISRTWLQVLERRALAKIAATTGGDAPPIPPWQKQYERDGRRAYKLERKRRADAIKASS